MELLAQYGLFLAKIATILIAIMISIILAVNARHSKRNRGSLRITRLNQQYKEMQEEMSLFLLDRTQKKKWQKIQKKKRKLDSKASKTKLNQNHQKEMKPHAYVLDFKGSIDAYEVASLREEITAVLSVVRPGDHVILRLESAGGLVHGYGLAASQLQRLREKQIPLTVTVDKIAASGGYMMACVADKIVAAPFSIIGSIGVLAQLPNFNRFLKSKEIDIELHTAGQHKRTLTLLGKNTEEGRKKFRENLNQTHNLFKNFVKQMRPSLNIEQVATGEHWYGIQAKEKGLIDEIKTSDDLLLMMLEKHELIGVRFIQRKKFLDRFIDSAAESTDRLFRNWLQHGQNPPL